MKRKLGIFVMMAAGVVLSLCHPVFAEDGVSIHGFASQGYLKSSHNNFLAESDRGSFQFNEMGISFMFDSSSNVSIGAQLTARDLGDVGNDTVAVNWAFGDYKWRQWLGFRAGIMKLPLGLYHESRDVDSLRTWILLPQAVYDEWMRDGAQGLKGISAYGNIDMAAGGMLLYDFKVADLAVSTDSGLAQYIINSSQVISSLDELNYNDVYFGSLKWYTPLEGLLLGVTGMTLDVQYLANNSTVIVETSDYLWMIYSLEYTYNNLVLATEWSLIDSDRRAYAANATPGSYANTKGTSYYVSASYRFLDWLEMGVYYSEKVNNDDLDTPQNELKDYCLSSRFDINDNMVFKLEAHKMDGLYGVAADNDGTLDDSWYLYAAKVSYSF